MREVGPRLRQAVVAARDLKAVVARLREELGLPEPFADPGVEYFGLRNAVFTLGDTFLEVVSPVRDDAAAARLLERRGADCGYMLMAQVDDLAAARRRVANLGIREVFAIELDDITEVHLHPADMGGAIVSLSTPSPPAAWRWGGPDWGKRSAPLSLVGATIAVADPERVRERWRAVIGGLPGLGFTEDPAGRGLIEVYIAGAPGRAPIDLGTVRLLFDR